MITSRNTNKLCAEVKAVHSILQKMANNDNPTVRTKLPEVLAQHCSLLCQKMENEGDSNIVDVAEMVDMIVDGPWEPEQIHNESIVVIINNNFN